MAFGFTTCEALGLRKLNSRCPASFRLLLCFVFLAFTVMMHQVLDQLLAVSGAAVVV